MGFRDAILAPFRATEDYKRKVAFVEQVNKRCDNEIRSIRKQQMELEAVLNDKVKDYKALTQEALEKWKTYQIVHSVLVHNDNEGRSCFSNEGIRSIQMNSTTISTDISGAVGTGMATGAAMGAAAGGGAAGLVALFGAASTGTAISSLSGAAFSHALLAALGGGSLAAGGFGMVGGMVVLGSSLLLPAIAVAAYMGGKKINAAYEAAIRRIRELDELQTSVDAFFKQFADGLDCFGKMLFDFRGVCQYVDELLNMSVTAGVTKHRAEYDNILTEAFGILSRYTVLSLTDEKGELNHQVEAQMEELRKQCGGNRERLQEFRDKITVEEQYDMQESKERALRVQDEKEFRNRLEEKEREIEYEREVYRQFKELKRRELEEANKNLAQTKKENDSLKINMEVIRQQLVEAEDEIKALHDDDERASRILEMYEEEQSRRIKQNELQFAEVKKQLAARYECLDERAIVFVATAEVMYTLLLQEKADMDFSPVGLDYAKSIEYLLHKRLEDLGKTVPKRIMLGQMYNEFVKNQKDWDDDFKTILNKLIELRNDTAHGGNGILQREQAEHMRILVLGSNNGPDLDMYRKLYQKYGLLGFFNKRAGRMKVERRERRR